MSLEAYKGLLENFGRSIGLAGAAPDEGGYCAMSFDETVVHFQYDEGEVTIFAKLGEVDEDRVEGIYGVLLAANMFWQGTKGATVSVEPDSRLAFIADRRAVSHLSDGIFQEWLGGFVDIADYWTQRLAALNTGAPLVDGDDDADGDDGDFPPGGVGGPDAPFLTRV